MKLRHRFAITLLDKMIIALALFIVSLDVTNGFQNVGTDLVFVLLVVFGLYIGVVIFANIPGIFIHSESRFTKTILGFFGAVVIFLLYPWVLDKAFWLLGIELSMAVETVLLITFVVRAALGLYLGRRWKEVAE